MAKSTKFRLLAAGLAVAVSAAIASAAGMFPGFPIVGAPSYCSSWSGTGSGTGSSTFPGSSSGFAQVCNVTVPAGPAYSGDFLFPADTNYTQGQQPQTVLVPGSYLGSVNAKTNLLIGGDFTTNLWQRGTTPLSAATPTTSTMAADRWAAYSSGNTVTITKQTGASDTIPTSGFYASMRVSRPSGTNTSQICVGQVLDSVQAAPLIGNNAVFSFYALAGAGLSAVANNTLSVYVAYYTAADSATPGTNTDAFMKATITGYTNAIGGGSSQPATTTTVSSGVASLPITTSWTRYGFYAPIPSTNSSGTAVTGVGVKVCYTPTSGTGGSTEWFELIGAQLQPLNGLATANLPNGLTSPTAFQRRPAAYEAGLQQAYSYILTDGAATVYYHPGLATTTALAKVLVNFPVAMRIAPSVTVGTAISFAVTKSDGTAQACGTSIAAVSSSTTTQQSTLLCTTGATALTAGNVANLMGAATGGLITWSAEP
jgi:hypothetical protein